MRVIVCGGRGFNDWTGLFEVMDRLHLTTPITAVIEGGASGADAWARHWAEARQVKNVTVPALWKEHHRAAGPIRNQRMLDDFSPDLVVAFPGGRGTADMVRRAETAGVRVMRVTDSSDASHE